RRFKLAQTIATFLGEAEGDHLPGLVMDSEATLERSLAAAEAQALLPRLSRVLAEQHPLLLEIVGPPGTGRQSLALAFAQALKRPLLVADCQPTPHRDLRQILAEAERDQQLTQAILCLRNFSQQVPRPMIPSEGMGLPSEERPLPAAMKSFLARHRSL